MSLVVKTVERADEESIIHLVGLLTRYLRTARAYNFVVDRQTGRNKIDTSIFSILSRAFALRYQKEQLTMVKSHSSGIPLYSLFCQSLAELMLEVKKISDLLDANLNAQKIMVEEAEKDGPLDANYKCTSQNGIVQKRDELESQHKALSSTTLKKSTSIKDASNNGDDAAEENDSDGVVKQTIKQKDKSGVTEQKSKSKG